MSLIRKLLPFTTVMIKIQNFWDRSASWRIRDVHAILGSVCFQCFDEILFSLSVQIIMYHDRHVIQKQKKYPFFILFEFHTN